MADAVRAAHAQRRRNAGEADWLTTARGLEIAYSELRTAETAELPKVEMSYIGG